MDTLTTDPTITGIEHSPLQKLDALPIQVQGEIFRELANLQEQGFDLIDPTQIEEGKSDIVTILVPDPSDPQLNYDRAGIQIDSYQNCRRQPSYLCEEGTIAFILNPATHQRIHFAPEPSFFEPEDDQQVISRMLPVTLETTDYKTYQYMYHYDRACKPKQARPRFTSSRSSSLVFFLSRG